MNFRLTITVVSSASQHRLEVYPVLIQSNGAQIGKNRRRQRNRENPQRKLVQELRQVQSCRRAVFHWITHQVTQHARPTDRRKVDGLRGERLGQDAVVFAWFGRYGRAGVVYGDDEQDTGIPHAYASIAMGAGNNSVKFASGSSGGSINRISRMRSTLAMSRVTSIGRAGSN